MKIAIIETAHFQYALTETEIFSDCNITYILTADMKSRMIDYSPETESGNFIVIESVENNEKEIVDFVNHNSIDMLFVNPIFDSYGALHRIVKAVNCKKMLTTHNINTWFNGRFWSPNSFMDRVNMRGIIKNCDYIAVEDFIYNYLKSTNHKYYQENNFVYIPFTIFHKNKIRKYQKNEERLKVVLTGGIDGDRRRYEDVIEVIEFLGDHKNEITFSFAGRAKGDYGRKIQAELDRINKIYPNLVSYFDDNSTADMFRKEMETSDLVLSTSTVTFKGMGTIEYIGKTKPTAAIHDMMSYELPGLLPGHLKTPENLKGSVFNYNSIEDLKDILTNLLNDKVMLGKWKEQARINSLNFTAEEIRKNLPF